MKTYSVRYYCPVDISVNGLYNMDIQGINEEDVRQKFKLKYPEPEIYIKDVTLIAK